MGTPDDRAGPPDHQPDEPAPPPGRYPADDPGRDEDDGSWLFGPDPEERPAHQPPEPPAPPAAPPGRQPPRYPPGAAPPPPGYVPWSNAGPATGPVGPQPGHPEGAAGPARGSPPRRPARITTRRRRPWLWTILAVVAALGVLCVGGVVVAYTTTKRHGEGDRASARTVPVGRAGRDENFELLVSHIDCGNDRVSGTGGTLTPDGQYCLVTLTVRNAGEQPAPFPDDAQRAVGTNRRTYPADTAASRLVNDGQYAFAEPIEPRHVANGIIVFDLPRNIAVRRVELHASAASRGLSVTPS